MEHQPGEVPSPERDFKRVSKQARAEDNDEKEEDIDTTSASPGIHEITRVLSLVFLKHLSKAVQIQPSKLSAQQKSI